jgi:amylosucrase
MQPVTPSHELAQRADELARRADEWRDDLLAALAGVYGDRADDLAARIITRAQVVAGQRRADLRRLDRVRERDPGWYQHPERVGYIAYADRFGGDLAGVAKRVGYLTELGIDVLHLMSVLRPRPGDSDGGYAIEDYRTPDPRLGGLDDLDTLCALLRNAGISICLDLVMNHTSETHEWAGAARAGSPYHRELYLTFPDRTVPDAYEASLPEIFPEMSPGNFTWEPQMRRWVWTTFREFQWDLNWANPDVLVEMLDVLFHLANVGVDIVRLDAVAFTWKRLGTNCQNQPEAHLIAQILRAALGIAAPATALLAEAIVGPDDLLGYLGRHEHERRECQLAYHNQLMVQSWSMIATKRAELAMEALSRLPTPPLSTTWFTYVRCHDDIGWAVADRDAWAVGFDGASHRAFLAQFFRGDYFESFARGAPFSSNSLTGDERTCGMTAALCGITGALEITDPVARQMALDEAMKRHLLLHAIAFGFGGIPMVYMGDELGQGDDESYLAEPDIAGDSRWRHRPWFDEAAAAQRHDAATVAGRAWANVQRLVAARRRCRPLHGEGRVSVAPTGDGSLFVWRREHARFGTMIGVANVGGTRRPVPAAVVAALDHATVVDLLDESAAPGPVAGRWHVEPLGVRWLTADHAYRTIPAPPD